MILGAYEAFISESDFGCTFCLHKKLSVNVVNLCKCSFATTFPWHESLAVSEQRVLAIGATAHVFPMHLYSQSVSLTDLQKVLRLHPRKGPNLRSTLFI